MAAAGSSAPSLTAVVKAHGAERAARRADLEAHAAAALAAADALTSDATAALGLELATVAANGVALESSAARYVKQIGELARVSASYRASFDGLAAAAHHLGSTGPSGGIAVWLERSEAALAGVAANFATVERFLGEG